MVSKPEKTIMTFGDIISAASLIGSILAIIMAWRKLPHDIKKTDGETSETFAKAADMTATQNVRLQEQIERMEGRQDEQEAQIKQLQETNKAKDSRIAELEKLTQEQEHKIQSQALRIQELQTELDMLRNRNQNA